MGSRGNRGGAAAKAVGTTEEESSGEGTSVISGSVSTDLVIPKGFRNRFCETDSDENILFVNGISTGDDVEIKGGTLTKLVERLSMPDQSDPTFVKTFLLTYRSFTTPMELLMLLINRFYAVQKPVRLRVFAVLKVWVTGYFYDFEDDELVKRFEKFCKEEIESVMPSGSRQLLTLLDKARSKDENMKKKAPISSKEIPRPHILTCKPSEVSILTIHPQELARQLTLIEAKLFNEIKPWELLNLAWSRKDKEQKAPNVLAMIKRTNLVTPWISSQIVSSKSMKVRVEILTRCIQTMVYLDELHNFNGIMEFIAALKSAGVFRLKETFARLDKKHQRSFDLLSSRMTTDNNYKIFRESLRTVSPPSIPYLGLFLTDLTFIEDGHPDYYNDEKTVINVVKRVQYAQVIKNIKQYQETPYLLQPVPLIMDFLKNIPQMKEEEVYDESLSIKPRSEGAKEVDDDSVAEKPNTTKPKLVMNVVDWGEIDYAPDYPFATEDNDDNIEIDDDNHKLIILATIPKLVERLTFEKYSDQQFVSAFLLTHRLMVSSEELIDLLIQRYNVPYPKDCASDVATKYEAKVVRPIRLRVFNALKQWVDKYGMDFEKSEELSSKLEKFAEETMKKTGMQKPAERLIEGLKDFSNEDGSRKSGLAASGSKNLKKPNAKIPPVMLPKSGKVTDVSFLEIPPLEIARQLTLIEFQLYQEISDREILNWKEDDLHFDSPGVFKLKKHNTWLYDLTISLVLNQNVKMAVKYIENLVNVADQLRVMNNFNACRCVVEGLLSPEISSLEGIWVSISSKTARIFDSLKDLVQEIKNFFKNAQWMQKVSAPALPSLTSYLDELARIEIAMPDEIENLTHMFKRVCQAKTVNDFLVFQTTTFVFEKVFDFDVLFSSLSVMNEEQMAENVRRLNVEALEEDVQSIPTLKDKVTSKVTSVMRLNRQENSSNRSSLHGVKALAKDGGTGPEIEDSEDGSGGKRVNGSPNTSPRQQMSAGVQRRMTRSSTRDLPISPTVTQEWIQNYVQNAIAEAVKPLNEEIERLKEEVKRLSE
jgi:hypothetical protein